MSIGSIAFFCLGVRLTRSMPRSVQRQFCQRYSLHPLPLRGHWSRAWSGSLVSAYSRRFASGISTIASRRTRMTSCEGFFGGFLVRSCDKSPRKWHNHLHWVVFAGSLQISDLSSSTRDCHLLDIPHYASQFHLVSTITR